jgi:plastocyanin
MGLAALAMIALALLVAACGSGSTATTAGSTSTTAGSPATTSSGGATTVQVEMKSLKFNPASVTVNAGDTVVWTNADSAQHDVVADNGEFKSDLFGQGKTFSFTFAKAGTYPYRCTVHAGMTGTVIVK